MAIARDMAPVFWELISKESKVVQEMALKYPPELLYADDKHGLKCLIEAYNEDGTVDVLIMMLFNEGFSKNWIIPNIDPETLIECDIPDCAEPV